MLGLFATDESAMAILRAVAALKLPDWAIGAGFVRNRVWDALSGFTRPTPPSDIDVLYHDPSDVSPAREAAIEAELCVALPDAPWSVRNQARMHVKNGDPPYGSTENALRFWLETPTAVAVRLDEAGRLRLLAPHGLDDLFAFVVRPTPSGRARFDAYRRRVAEKNWPALWPGVRVEY
jgi:hypothetical protein